MNKREIRRVKRHKSIKLKMRGTPEMPRLVVRRSLKHFSAQIVDDTENSTLLSLATYDKAIKAKFSSAGNVKSAQEFGNIFSAKAREKGITKIIFDRAGYLYHGRIKAFAEALRKGGLQF
ncbi:MAG: 50S ribosomal protein L18 [Candidatus Omnitrophota bacterium]|nr:50S ribosomal protein L18 [Candidatus Omnitrophota bacterium]